MGQEIITSNQDYLPAHGWRRWGPRLLASALGLILLIACVLKATDMELFVRQIRDYGILSDPLLLALGAWGLIVIECAIGVGLLVFYRPKLFLPLAGLLLLIFVGATSWAWLTSTAEECGCFGAFLRHTPGVAALGNLILLAATFVAWVGLRHMEVSQVRAKAWALVAACLVGFILPLAFGFSPMQSGLSPWKSLENELGSFEIQGVGQIDLRHGAYLILLMDTECSHCQEAIPELNDLAEETELLRVIMLCTNDEQQRKAFVEQFGPVFPIGKIMEDAFVRLLGLGYMPRTILVHDQRVLKVWDEHIPGKPTVEAALRD